MTDYKSYNTERLIIKPTTVEDADFIFQILNMPKWIQNIGDRNVKSVDDAKDYITTKMQPQLERLGYSNYTVIRERDNAKIGICGLYDRAGLEGLDIGFAFLPPYERMGYAFEAAEKIKNIAFKELGIKSISAITSKTNVASQKLLVKLGFDSMGITKLPDDSEELLLYKIEHIE